MDALDSRFAELLGNYLEASNLEPPADLGAALTGGRKRDHDSDSYSDSASNDDDDSDDDYVYDIYYRDMIPSRTGPAGAAESGLQPAAVPGHERLLATRSSLPESMALPRVQGGAVVPAEMAPPATAHFPGLDVAGAETVMAQLEGFEDTDDELDAGDDAEGYESYDEGEDEDSNDEDFYRNDYPKRSCRTRTTSTSARTTTTATTTSRIRTVSLWAAAAAVLARTRQQLRASKLTGPRPLPPLSSLTSSPVRWQLLDSV
ncbi:uncharacterized protein PSFLO_04801 [Pseudozyma flocculosa]|uniref:Transcription factor Iwr1 domain-containing protein n=1 Tax=Pseudozyma flocculosa TaxID=84751 RepID=A0A5C3F5C8_9BASI|nr:uncharacterized protein PSFLO_04801 [Pseudozyma flocculosa]